MSSRKLLALLEHLPDDSAFKKATRNGDWNFGEYLQAGVLNEIRLLRIDQAALNGQKMDAELLESPAQIERREELNREREVHRAGILAQLYGHDLGGNATDAS